MSDAIRFKITSGPLGRNTVIECNGRKITNCRMVDVHAEVDSATTLTLEFTNVYAEIEAEVEPENITVRRNAMGQTAYVYEQAVLI